MNQQILGECDKMRGLVAAAVPAEKVEEMRRQHAEEIKALTAKIVRVEEVHTRLHNKTAEERDAIIAELKGTIEDLTEKNNALAGDKPEASPMANEPGCLYIKNDLRVIRYHSRVSGAKYGTMMAIVAYGKSAIEMPLANFTDMCNVIVDADRFGEEQGA